MSANPDTAGTKLKISIFISYAREDSAVAYRLDAALSAQGFAVLIDKTGIAPGEDWRKRIDGMIRAANVVVFVLSPDSVDSEICTWEVERTEELKKRLLPIKWRSVDGLALPPGLSRPNWLDFSEAERIEPAAKQAFDAALAKLMEAIETDIGWVRQHTEFTARAERWKDADRPVDQFLLSGIEISNAQLWVSQRPEQENISEVFYDYLKASLQREQSVRREVSLRIGRIIGAEARRARESHRHASAMRFALAAEPSATEETGGVAPEASCRAHLAAAAHASLCLVSLSGHARGHRNAL